MLKLPDRDWPARERFAASVAGWEEFFFKYRLQILFAFVGIILIGSGLFLFKVGGSNNNNNVSSNTVEVLESSTQSDLSTSGVVVEVVGAVQDPGVYRLESGARVEDALQAAGGISADADQEWMEKALNRAAKVVDGQKIYIPQSSVSSANIFTPNTGVVDVSGDSLAGSTKLVNINTASQKSLESLWGIGPKRAQNIIDNRYYSSVEELLTKKIIPSNVYERNRDKLTIY